MVQILRGLQTAPSQVLGLDTGVSAVDMGRDLNEFGNDTFTCAIGRQGVMCWGRNDFGQLGGMVQLSTEMLL